MVSLPSLPQSSPVSPAPPHKKKIRSIPMYATDFQVKYNAEITALFLFCEVLVEQRNSLDTLIELIETEALVG